MENNEEYNPLEIKEGLIIKLFNNVKAIFKKFKRLFLTVGVLGISTTLLTFGVDKLIEKFYHDEDSLKQEEMHQEEMESAKRSEKIAKEISETLAAMQEDFQRLQPINIPDSLLTDPELAIINGFLVEFELYKDIAKTIDFSAIQTADYETRLNIYLSRIHIVAKYINQSQKLFAKATDILKYEAEKGIDGITIDLGQMNNLEQCMDATDKNYKEIEDSLTIYLGLDKRHILKDDTRKQLYKIIERTYSSVEFLNQITGEKRFYNSLYTQIKIRLKQIQKE